MNKKCSHSGIPCEHLASDGGCVAPYDCPYSYDADARYTVSSYVGSDGTQNDPQEVRK